MINDFTHLNFKETWAGKQKGFTLLEVLIYIGVLGIIVVAVSSYFLWSIQASTKVKVIGETLDNARRTMEIMVYEIREAESIYTETSIFDFHPGQLSLETKKYLPEGENTTYIDFYLSEGKLCLKKESQSPICFTSERVEVTSLVFSQIGNSNLPSIQIDLSVDYRNPTGRPEYQAQVNLRNVASFRSY